MHFTFESIELAILCLPSAARAYCIDTQSVWYKGHEILNFLCVIEKLGKDTCVKIKTYTQSINSILHISVLTVQLVLNS